MDLTLIEAQLDAGIVPDAHTIDIIIDMITGKSNLFSKLHAFLLLTPEHITKIFARADIYYLEELLELFEGDITDAHAELVMPRLPKTIPLDSDWVRNEDMQLYFLRQFSGYRPPTTRALTTQEMFVCLCMAPQNFSITTTMPPGHFFFTMALFRTNDYRQLFLNNRAGWTLANISIALLRVDLDKFDDFYAIFPEPKPRPDIYNARHGLTPHQVSLITSRAMEGDFTDRRTVLYQCDPDYIIPIMNQYFPDRTQAEEFVGLIRSRPHILFSTPLVRPNEHLQIFLIKTDFFPVTCQPIDLSTPAFKYMYFLKCPQAYMFNNEIPPRIRLQVLMAMSPDRFESYFANTEPTPKELKYGWLYKIDPKKPTQRRWLARLDHHDKAYLMAQCPQDGIVDLFNLIKEEAIIPQTISRLRGRLNLSEEETSRHAELFSRF